MNSTDLERFNLIYEQHLSNLKMQGERPATIDAYFRAVRWIRRDYPPCNTFARLQKSIKAAPLRERIVQFTYIEARACSTLGFNVGYATLNPYLL